MHFVYHGTIIVQNTFIKNSSIIAMKLGRKSRENRS